MISQEQANAALAQAARGIMELTYDDLGLLDKRLPGSPEDEWRELPSIAVGNERFHVHLLIGKIGWFRRRFSVEMVLNSEDGTQWPRVPCVYFERFKSGRLYPSRREQTREAVLLKVLPYAFVLVVIGLLALVWHLFLRGG